MAKIAADIEKSVEAFLAALRQVKRVDMAYLYGSRAKGEASEWSDIDVAVISADFSTDLFEERVALLRLAVKVDDRIEPWPFTPDTFNSSDPLASEIKRTGIRIG